MEGRSLSTCSCSPYHDTNRSQRSPMASNKVNELGEMDRGAMAARGVPALLFEPLDRGSKRK